MTILIHHRSDPTNLANQPGVMTTSLIEDCDLIQEAAQELRQERARVRAVWDEFCVGSVFWGDPNDFSDTLDSHHNGGAGQIHKGANRAGGNCNEQLQSATQPVRK